MKICDLTQFYSPVSGGVKRYLHEKIDYIDRHASRYEHVLIVPGAKTKLKANGRSRVYTIRSPLVSRTRAIPRAVESSRSGRNFGPGTAGRHGVLPILISSAGEH